MLETSSRPLEQTRDIGWLITMVSAGLALWGSWVLFPLDAVGMWAGYWVSALATVSLLSAMWLRTTLPAAPAIVVSAASGGVLALLGAVRDYPATISVVMVAGGVGIALGSLLQTVRSSSAVRS